MGARQYTVKLGYKALHANVKKSSGRKWCGVGISSHDIRSFCGWPGRTNGAREAVDGAGWVVRARLRGEEFTVSSVVSSPLFWIWFMSRVCLVSWSLAFVLEAEFLVRLVVATAWSCFACSVDLDTWVPLVSWVICGDWVVVFVVWCRDVVCAWLARGFF
ncbi:hypothetical protein Dimus_036868 [Dionaea muscipula]